jgi:hypothetical protein
MSFQTGLPGMSVADHPSGHGDGCAKVFRVPRRLGLLAERPESVTEVRWVNEAQG